MGISVCPLLTLNETGFSARIMDKSTGFWTTISLGQMDGYRLGKYLILEFRDPEPEANRKGGKFFKDLESDPKK